MSAPDESPHAPPSAPGAERVPEILNRLGELEELALGLAAELADYPAGGPWHWRELDAAQRAELWAELDDFVAWLQNRILSHSSNPDMWIEPCWYRHPDVVEQLTAVMVAHAAAYRPKSHKPSFAPADWFHRVLWPTMGKIAERDTFTNCRQRDGHHGPEGTRKLTAGSAEFDDFLRDQLEGPGTDA
ncbi:hypothetical protein SPF06_19740 [Sinomonas sp. JGH33]|uniref:DUF4913 domain-containing protein n=1 Tax=Sinomonas terricola TaxID=3110330 RepID=A0ABU5TB93_9MICC|nr:hypothetical protein [Sinomonas sp. JGH33]MEA5456961.1 hypothetical protein [Sinomonas sp. JGH33]